MPNLTDFIASVEKMRTLQKSYFKEKDPYKKQSLLIESKQMEKEVDTGLIQLQEHVRIIREIKKINHEKS